MAVDFARLIYPAQAVAFGVEATLTLSTNPTLGEIELTVIDKTKGVELFNPTSVDRTDTYIQTVVPAALVRVSDLIEAEVGADVDAVRVALRGATLTMNGKDWRVEGSQPRATPRGENDGRLLLFLIEV